MTELLQHSIHSLNFQLTSNLSSIPSCTIRHANGQLLNFQVCVHQDPLGGSSCLDYWLIRSHSDIIEPNTAAAISVIRLSPYGTIEQVQPSRNFKQPISELLGRPVMAFVYQDDVEPLCASLAKICSVHKQYPAQDPLFIRWSRLPCLISSSEKEETSLDYDWMSFTLMSSNNNIAVGNSIRPICILRPLQCEQEETMVIHVSLFDQFVDYYQSLCEAAKHSKVYLSEFYNHVLSSLIEIIAYIWDLVKSNYIMQTSLGILQFAGLLDQHHIKIIQITK
ncbi:uncharacterized protein EV154DRAFT_413917 [Mucor mucedo]|uniref:uncharacterized protein n=1 Tax=Mucor mucedo TaxID=29922 RepID=UPI00221E8558|nr:uncharacterized protein EV154DRAFT_413917 [Mucor mucedo]KAI7894988.1 hypothetical protein EV154DRAFT_413917 [Mucor mucedo]